MPNTETLTANGLEFTVDTAGKPGAPLVVLLHGFPHSRHTWQHQLTALAGAGYHAVAPDQRGYSPGARPADLEAYTVEHLCDDVLAIAHELGHERFHLVGHDWGGQLGWLMAAGTPERVASLTVLSRPHPDAFRDAKHTDPQQGVRSKHHTLFSDAGMVERLGRHDFERLQALMRFENGALIFDDEELERQQEHGARRMPEADVQAYTEPLKAPSALEAALNWYRANVDDLGAPNPLGPVTVPTLYLWGAQDGGVGRIAAERTARYVEGPFEFVEVPTVGHYLVEHEPRLVNRHLLDHVTAYGSTTRQVREPAPDGGASPDPR